MRTCEGVEIQSGCRGLWRRGAGRGAWRREVSLEGGPEGGFKGGQISGQGRESLGARSRQGEGTSRARAG